MAKVLSMHKNTLFTTVMDTIIKIKNKWTNYHQKHLENWSYTILEQIKNINKKTPSKLHDYIS